MITVYSAPWCAFCHAVKQYLDGLKIEYKDKDVDADLANAKEAVDKSGQMGIPVIDIDGKIIIGFNRPVLDSALREAKLIK